MSQLDTTGLLNQLSQLVHLTDNLARLSEDQLKPIYAAVEALMRESQSYLERATEAEERAATAEDRVKMLLATIHCDAGEAQEEDGTEEAMEAAICKVERWHAAWTAYAPEAAVNRNRYQETGEQ